MVDARLLSRCGIYCGACFIYRAERDGGALLDEVAKRYNVPKEEIRCNGCSGPHAEQWRNCQGCNLVACQRRRGIGNCAQCEEFETCPDYGYLTRFAAYRGEDLMRNLKRIESGDSGLLEEQERRWRCPRCDAPLMWYDNKCRRCGEKVREEPITMDGFRE
ncbi:MAG: DUF3795 domain-containing protein [Candidatus Bathyarchaeota archaeon]|nr:DUF3795 domain-containing protein [Candidatus Bathyarchaeota archaeon]